VLVVFRVVARLPDGVTPTPVEVVWLLSVVTPSLLVVCCVLLELEPPSTGATIGAVVWVDVVLDDEVCATATPVIIMSAVVAASQYLVMSCYSGERSTSEHRSVFPAVTYRARRAVDSPGKYLACTAVIWAVGGGSGRASALFLRANGREHR
jgi:hypothetical protein